MKREATGNPTSGSSILGFLFSFLLLANWVHAAPQPSLQQIFKQNAPAMVLIRIVDSAGKTLALGSGFLVRPSGVIVTNHHVIEPKAGARLEVKLPNGDTYEDVWVIHDEERRDLAVLLIKAAGLPTVKLGDSDRVEVGEQVVAIGHPKGLEMTFTAGIVSAIRPMPGKGYRFIQHQTPISPGSSGGPLLNMNGEVIGINTFGFEGGQNLNGAVPVNYVKAYLQDPPKMTYEQYARARGVPPAETKQPAAPSVAWKPYRNGRYGFSFEYPADWQFKEEELKQPTELKVELKFSQLENSVIVLLDLIPGELFTFRDKKGQPAGLTGQPIDLEKTLEWAYMARDLSGRTLSEESLRSESHAGYYRVFENPVGGVPEIINIDVRGVIFTKSLGYYRVHGGCQFPRRNMSFFSYCEGAFVQMMKSFKFAK